jgi:hypothetical protein
MHQPKTLYMRCMTSTSARMLHATCYMHVLHSLSHRFVCVRERERERERNREREREREGKGVGGC